MFAFWGVIRRLTLLNAVEQPGHWYAMETVASKLRLKQDMTLDMDVIKWIKWIKWAEQNNRQNWMLQPSNRPLKKDFTLTPSPASLVMRFCTARCSKRRASAKLPLSPSSWWDMGPLRVSSYPNVDPMLVLTSRVKHGNVILLDNLNEI